MENGDKLKRVKKKVKHGNSDDPNDQDDENITEQGQSFKEKLLGFDTVQVSKDKKGSSVIDDAWAEYIEGLQGFFQKPTGGEERQEDSDDEDCHIFKFTREE